MFERYIKTEDFLELPLSQGHYFIHNNGTVKDANGKVLSPTVDSDSDSVISIDWILGLQEYKVALLLCFTFKPVALPVKFWGELTVLFKDGDHTNLDCANLVWKFPIGLGASDYNGYAFIPMFTNYLVNKNGELKDIRTGEIPKMYPKKNKGYIIVSLTVDINNKHVLMSRHRLVAFAWLDYPANIDDMEVNHDNCKPGCDTADNLEIMTRMDNIQHYVKVNADIKLIKYPKLEPVLVRNIFTNQISEYVSKAECMKALNITYSVLMNILSRTDHPVYDNSIQIKLKADSKPWTNVSVLETSMLYKNFYSGVHTRDVRTGELQIFTSINECARKLNLTKDAVNWRLNAVDQKVFPEYKQYKRADDSTPWRIPDDYEVELEIKGHRHSLLVRDIFTGNVTEYATQKDCAYALGISENTPYAWLRKLNQPIFMEKYQLKLKSDPTPWRIPDNIVHEINMGGTTKNILVKNAKTGEIRVFNSARDCCRQLEMLPTTLNWRLDSKGQKIYPGYLMFKRASEHMPWFEPSDDYLSKLQFKYT